MDKQNNSHQEPILLQLPIELLVYIISFLSSVHDKINLQYVSKWLKYVIEGTPSLWKEFVLPYCDSSEEDTVKEMLRVHGKHIKTLSFPQCKLLPSTMVKMLQCCSNVQHLNLSSTTLDPDQLREITDHMQYLQSLEIKIEFKDDMKKLLHAACHLKQLTIVTDLYSQGLIHWNKLVLKPANFKLILSSFCFINNSSSHLVDLVSHLQWSTTIPTGTTANFKLCNRASKVPLNFSPTFPQLQFELEGSGQVTAPFVKLSDCGIVGIHDVAMVTDCEYGTKTLYMVRFPGCNFAINELNSMHIPKLYNLSCVTHFDLDRCGLLHSGHLEQLAIACSNLQRLNLHRACYCLENLQGLQAIASHCHNLQGLNLLCIPVSYVENLILFWEILSNMKLTHLAIDDCLLLPEAAMKEKLISLYQKCWSIRGIQCNVYRVNSANEGVSMLRYFLSLKYCYLTSSHTLPTVVQDVINNCNKLETFKIKIVAGNIILLKLAHIHNLQQFCIDSVDIDVPNDFMMSVSAHGGLVHVIMRVGSLSGEGIRFLVKNSPKLITLHLCARAIHHTDGTMTSFNATLKKLFCFRKLFTGGHYMVNTEWYQWRNNISEVVYEQETDLLPLWYGRYGCH